MPAGDERKTPTRTRFLELVREVYGIGPGQYDAVPYAGGVLSALRLGRPDRGNVLITGGFDGYLEDRFAMMTAITHAGYQVIAFDGPGRGAALEDSGMILTPDWHRPVGAVLDHFGLHQATLIGSSLCGCLAITGRHTGPEPAASPGLHSAAPPSPLLAHLPRAVQSQPAVSSHRRQAAR